jgi:very-short-patch-repair endonuclease
MWKDLKDRIQDLKANPFVDHLIETPQKPYVQDVQFHALGDLDHLLKPSEVFAPLNADSAQLIAIDASAKRQDFVLEGPPGTGKSETIANIICHNLAKGKKVLFVAEKMAALNVVYSRLNKIGLDHLCLELHSNKANKRVILEQLKKAWIKRETAEGAQWHDDANKLFDIRQNLNLYVEELHRDCVLGITPRQAISRYSRFKEVTKFKLDWGNSIAFSPVKSKAELEILYTVSKKTGLAFSDTCGIDLQPFAIVQQSDWSNAWQAQFIAEVQKIKHSASELNNAFERLIDLVGLNELSKANQHYADINELSQSLIEQKSSLCSFVFTADARANLEKLDEVITAKRQLDAYSNKSQLTFSMDNIAAKPVSNWLATLRIAQQKMWPFKWFSTRKITKSINDAGIFGDTSEIELALLEKISALAKQLTANTAGFEKDKIWLGWETDEGYLNQKYLQAKALFDITRKVAGKVSEPVNVINHLKRIVVDNFEFFASSELASLCEIYVDKYNIFAGDLAGFTELGGELAADQSLSEFVTYCDNVLASQNKIKVWCNWLEAKNEASASGLQTLLDALERGLIKSNDAVAQVTNAVYIWLAPILIDNSTTLRTFNTSEHEHLIAEFRALDALVASTTAQYISAIVAAQSPDPNSPQSPAAYGVLSREFNKKSNHKPIRQLINEMGESLLNLTPCVMMSPLSVAQFLPSDFNAFDLVVFDEASQITVWDAVGTIARARNAIIVGDPKQMPPTNFFSKNSANDGTDEDDLESILDQALSARLPHHRLTGHYRSRHESLIAFSNSHYYENSLVTFPCAQTKESAVTLHKIEGIYAKGKERNNIKEANAVADFIVARLNSKNKKFTIGVVTLNSEQQRCIEDCLDDRRREFTHLEPYFQGNKNYDPIFVKNLESVQGDERDIIILSLGYGPTEALAKTMSMNFGPLNKQGGERRLNVAITRATTEIHLFASFDHTMIDLSRTSALAVKHLKYYLEFAEKGPAALPEIASADLGIDQFDGYFEETVASSLRGKGWKVQTQIGVGKFRIDLGIIHPDKPSTFLAGIECDGATYHGSPAARDRDRVRHLVLEGLGWQLLRIWSIDYFTDNEAVIEKIDAQLNALLQIDLAQVEEDDVSEELMMQDCENAEVKEGVANADDYFLDSYRATLQGMASDILKQKSAISLRELASDIGWTHDLARTTKKQLAHIESVISDWAGMVKHSSGEITLWHSPTQIETIVAWRGARAFGIPREWQTIALPEIYGLAKMALEKSPNDPVDFIFNEFGLSRRTKSTTAKFETWVTDYKHVFKSH